MITFNLNDITNTKNIQSNFPPVNVAKTSLDSTIAERLTVQQAVKAVDSKVKEIKRRKA